MKVDFSKIPLDILFIVITIPLGVKAIVIGNFVSTFICYFINAYLPGKMFNFGAIAQFKIFWKISIATALMTLCVWGSMQLFDSMIVKLCIGIMVGIISYIGTSFLLGTKEVVEIMSILRSFLKPKIQA